jgi:hypothetical protein
MAATERRGLRGAAARFESVSPETAQRFSESGMREDIALRRAFGD